MASHRRISRGLFAALITFAAITAHTPARAQLPGPSESSTPTPPVYSVLGLDGEQPNARVSAPQTHPQQTDVVTAPVRTTASAQADTATDVPTTLADLERGFSATASSAGQILVDATVNPISLRASESLTYTYYYTNVSGAAQNNVVAKLSWTGMKLTEPANIFDTTFHQVCTVTCQPFDVAGGSVVRGIADANGNNAVYTISSIGAGQSGRFSVSLRIRNRFYPQTGASPLRPASSIEIFTNNGVTKESDDTVSALVVGPVLNVNKIVVPGSPSRITISETVDFSITVGNASLPGDIIDNQSRSDARPASNVVIREQIPLGAQYVPTGDPAGITRTYDSATRIVTWQMGALAIQQTKDVSLRLRKDATSNGCTLLDNKVYDTTSTGYPIDPETGEQAIIKGRPVWIGVAPSVEIVRIDQESRNVIYGDEAAVTLTLASHYPNPINGAKLTVIPPPKMGYVPGSANPAGGFTGPSTQTYGQAVTWTLNFPAGSPSSPAYLTTTLRVKAERLVDNQVTFDDLDARFLVPGGVPVACITEQSALFITEPRLGIKIRRVLPNDRSPDLASDLSDLIQKGQQYRFEIEVKNFGNQVINNATITGELPSRATLEPNFVYVPGTGKFNNTPREPNRVSNGNGGFVAWDNITLQPKSTNLFLFDLNADGYEYVRYCLQGVVSSPEDLPIRTGIGSTDDTRRQGWCVRINPFVESSKIADNADLVETETPAQREVTFTLMLTNVNQIAYQFSLLDILANGMTFVRQVPNSSNAGEPVYDQLFNRLRWPMQTVQPGGVLSARIVVMVPQGCPAGEYANEIGFVFRASDGVTYDVVRIPPNRAQITCQNVLEYSSSVSPGVAGLKDRVRYTIQLDNRSQSRAMTNLALMNLLPRGFTFDSVATESDIKISPTQSTIGDRTLLTFNIPSVPAAGSKKLILVARTGNIIGSFENWVYATTNENYVVRCKTSFSGCRNELIEGRTHNVSHVAIAVEPLATLEPKLNTNECSLPGDERQYTLAMLNTNNHSYLTNVRIRIPFGLQILDYGTSSSAGVITLPTLSRDPNGDSVLTWSEVTLPEKAFTQVNSQILFNVRLRFGQVFVNTPIIAEATSDDGLILRKDDTVDPILKLCDIDRNYLFKEVSAPTVQKGETLIYQLSLLNIGPNTTTITLRDALPQIFEYQAMLVGPEPTRNGNTLTWSGFTVPARNSAGPGQAIVRFSVRTKGGAFNKQQVVNTGEAIAQGVFFDTSLASATVEFRTPPVVYLPLTGKR